MMTKNEFVADFERRHGHSRSTRVGAGLYDYLLPSYTEEDVEKAWEEYSSKEEKCEKSYLAHLGKKREYFLRSHRGYRTAKR